MTSAQVREILDHVGREWPNEACGLLGGADGRVRRVYPVTNMLRSPVAYEMEPVEQVRAMVDIEAAGWEICAIYHSHPAGPAEPSPTDVAQAYYPEALYVIAARQGGEWALRGFEIDAGQVRPAVLQVEQ